MVRLWYFHDIDEPLPDVSNGTDSRHQEASAQLAVGNEAHCSYDRCVCRKPGSGVSLIVAMDFQGLDAGAPVAGFELGLVSA